MRNTEKKPFWLELIEEMEEEEEEKNRQFFF